MIDRREAGAITQRSVLPGDLARADAFRALAEEHLDGSYALARAILRDPTDAQDAVQDAFIRAWRAWDGLRDPTRFEPWFGRILVNTCRTRLRARARSRVTEIRPTLEVAGRTDAYAEVADRELLGAALERLDADHRIVVALRYFADLTVDDIAARLQIPSGTVKSRLHTAMHRLQATLDDQTREGQVP